MKKSSVVTLHSEPIEAPKLPNCTTQYLGNSSSTRCWIPDRSESIDRRFNGKLSRTVDLDVVWLMMNEQFFVAIDHRSKTVVQEEHVSTISTLSPREGKLDSIK
jgi:hypothetical protein